MRHGPSCSAPPGVKRARRSQNVTYNHSTPSQSLYSLCEAKDDSGTPRVEVWRDEDEWSDYVDVGTSSVLHVDLAKRNQLLLIAPLCANTLATVALGLCGNLLGSVVRAWHYDMDEAFAAPLEAKYGEHIVCRPLCVCLQQRTLFQPPQY